MKKHKHHVVTVHYWIMKVVKSAVNLKHIEDCRNLVQNYERLYESQLKKRGYGHLSTVIRHAIDDKYWLFTETRIRELAKLANTEESVVPGP